VVAGPLLAFAAGVIVATLVGAWPVARLRRRLRDTEDAAKVRAAEAGTLRTRLTAAERAAQSAPKNSGNGADARQPTTDDQLADASERFRSLLDSLPFPLWVRDETLDVAFANRAAERTRPYEQADLAQQAHTLNAAASERRAAGADGNGGLIEIVETPVAGWPGMVGFAVEPAAATDGADRDILAGLTTAIAVYDAGARLAFFNDAYARLFHLDDGWLAAGPRLGDVLDRLRAARRLPEVADYRAFRAEQLGLIGACTVSRCGSSKRRRYPPN